MPIPFVMYLASWAAVCLVATVLVVRSPSAFSLLSPAYRAFLRAPWKVASFLFAAAGLTVVAPYSGDPTWDYVTAPMMAVLTFATAPWVLGTLYRDLRGRAQGQEIYVALVLWLFSASWCYDGYLVLRDGCYPVTWLANIPASSVLYFSAGFLWNLHWTPARGLCFAFTDAAWPALPAAPFRRLLWAALPFMAIAGGMILAFVLAAHS